MQFLVVHIINNVQLGLGTRGLFWHDKKADNVVVLFLTSGLAASICLLTL